MFEEPDRTLAILRQDVVRGSTSHADAGAGAVVLILLLHDEAANDTSSVVQRVAARGVNGFRNLRMTGNLKR
jgi:hypothetical protein